MGSKADRFSPEVMRKICSLCGGGFAGVSVVVVGDVMLDKYISGEVKRISPEAPVPVFLVKDERYVLGGAGNVVMNLRGLGIRVSLIGRVGHDSNFKIMSDILAENNIDFSDMLFHGSTIMKTRLMGDGRQQMIRIDREEIYAPSADEEDACVAAVAGQINCGAEAVIISDYAKGLLNGTLCQKIIAVCAKNRIPVLVDPKGTDWQRYMGAFMTTPNMTELSSVSFSSVPNDDDAVVEAGLAIKEQFGLQNMLVTRSSKGATLIEDQQVTHIPALEVEVFDVSGAGDTMIAVTAACVAAGLGVADSVRLANMASQIVVGKVGTYPIKSSDLLGKLYSMSSRGKIYSAEGAAARVAEWRSNGESVVFTNGCFDVFHAGHADSLKRARALGDHLIVGLNSDSSVRRLKGPSRPVNAENERAQVLASLSAVDIVVVFDEDTPEDILSKIRPDTIAKGGDYKPDEVVGARFADRVVILPLVDGLSSTKIIQRIESNGNK